MIKDDEEVKRRLVSDIFCSVCCAVLTCGEAILESAVLRLLFTSQTT